MCSKTTRVPSAFDAVRNLDVFDIMDFSTPVSRCDECWRGEGLKEGETELCVGASVSPPSLSLSLCLFLSLSLPVSLFLSVSLSFSFIEFRKAKP